MSTQGQQQIITMDTGAVITDTYQAAAALLYINLDMAGPGINTIFQQLLNHGGRTLNHLSSGNLVSKVGAEPVNPADTTRQTVGRGCNGEFLNRTHIKPHLIL
jgi:hypothetical protein